VFCLIDCFIGTDLVGCVLIDCVLIDCVWLCLLIIF
jgi:hypothetical protein